MFNNFLKKIFGDKNTKAYKELWPLVEEINQEYEKLNSLTDDELRGKSQELKEYLKNETAELRNQIAELRETLTKDEADDNDRDSIYDQLDKLNEELDAKYEDLLDGILPQAFAIVKDTCRRLVGKSWDAAGNKINWDMIPYDVQLLGGIVLHQGRIARQKQVLTLSSVKTRENFLSFFTSSCSYNLIN